MSTQSSNRIKAVIFHTMRIIRLKYPDRAGFFEYSTQGLIPPLLIRRHS